MKCPKCEAEMVAGYSSANVGLSWVAKGKFESFSFADKDLAGSGLKTLFPWKGEYFTAFNCPQCQIVVVDYSQKYDRKAVESAIAEQ